MTFQDQIRARMNQEKSTIPGRWDSEDIKEIYGTETEIQKNKAPADEPRGDLGRQDPFEY